MSTRRFKTASTRSDGYNVRRDGRKCRSFIPSFHQPQRILGPSRSLPSAVTTAPPLYFCVWNGHRCYYGKNEAWTSIDVHQLGATRNSSERAWSMTGCSKDSNNKRVAENPLDAIQYHKCNDDACAWLWLKGLKENMLSPHYLQQIWWSNKAPYPSSPRLE